MDRKTNRIVANRAKYDAILLASGCVDCGYGGRVQHLQADHVLGEKFMEVPEMIRNGYSWDAIAIEIAKCEIVCQHCHTDRTLTRMGIPLR